MPIIKANKGKALSTRLKTVMYAWTKSGQALLEPEEIWNRHWGRKPPTKSLANQSCCCQPGVKHSLQEWGEIARNGINSTLFHALSGVLGKSCTVILPFIGWNAHNETECRMVNVALSWERTRNRYLQNWLRQTKVAFYMLTEHLI